MNSRTPEEKINPFRLVKYFTFSSLIVIFIGTVMLAILNVHWARKMQFENSQTFAHALIENLNHQIFSQFFIPMVLKHGKIQLRDTEQFEHMDRVVRGTLHRFKVDMVTLYGMDNVISYSFDQDLVGKKNIGSTEYKKAQKGNMISTLVQRGNIFEIMLGVPKEIKIVTFAPLRAEQPMLTMSGPIGGVVELIQDLSEDYKAVFRFQVLVILTSAAVMGGLFLILLIVVKRGEAIFQQQTRERLKLKEQLNQAERLSSMGEMAAGISHEIRNPLGIIRSSAELLKKKMNGFDPTNRIPDIIVEEANRLNDIITDFFNYAKPRPPDLNPCRIDVVLEKNISFLSSQIDDRGCSVKTLFADNLPEIMADANMLYQAFLNLLINAMQAMPEGGEIRINAGVSNGAIAVLIEDQGQGIPEELLEKIWDPFYTTKETGTGLGLGIVKNIIESHGGNIYIDNSPGRGARVKVSLPITRRIS